LWITDCKSVCFLKFFVSRLQEVIFGQTPCIVPEVEGWPGQKPTDRITRIEEFKR
jgi:hypothetical protein